MNEVMGESVAEAVSHCGNAARYGLELSGSGAVWTAVPRGGSRERGRDGGRREPVPTRG